MAGDVEQATSLQQAIADCYGVHVNLAGGPQAADYDRVEGQGTANIAQAAATAGVQRLGYLSGASVRTENAWFYTTQGRNRYPPVRCGFFNF